MIDADAASARLKIANALIALETGVVKDVDEAIPYGGRPQPVKAARMKM